MYSSAYSKHPTEYVSRNVIINGMEIIGPIIIACLIVMSASLVGVVSIWNHLGKIIEHKSSLLVSFASGIFLVISINLILESITDASNIFIPIASIIFGAFFILLVFRTTKDFHHHHDSHLCASGVCPINPKGILAGDAIHNLGDGLLLTTAFLVSIEFGIAVTAGIFIHELVQEISEFFVLKQAGYTTGQALGINFIISGTILIGAIITLFFVNVVPEIEPVLLGIAAGSFLVVVFQDLIPHSVRASKSDEKYLHYIIAFVLGIIVMFSINFFTPHQHDEKQESHKVSILVNTAYL